MPRKGKGSRQQAPQAAAAHAYGETSEAITAQQQMPIHREPPVAEQMAAPTAAQDAQVDPMERLLAIAQGTDPNAVTPLSAPSTDPNEPVTAGIPAGPGPGPEGLAEGFRMQTRNPVADALEAAAAAGQNPALMAMAARARASSRRTPRY